MRVRRLVAAVTAVLGSSGMLLASQPASADAAAITVNFTYSAGSLSVGLASSTPVNLGTASGNVLGTSVSGALPLTTVTDTRAQVAGAWTDVVTFTDFTTSAPVQTITKSNAKAYSGVTTLAGGTGVAPGTPLVANAVGDGGTLVSMATELGSTTLTFTPTVSITIPANSVSGAYSGTVTQTVS